jgi:hypothetical protein
VGWPKVGQRLRIGCPCKVQRRSNRGIVSNRGIENKASVDESEPRIAS